jgi:hypothetical protein
MDADDPDRGACAVDDPTTSTNITPPTTTPPTTTPPTTTPPTPPTPSSEPAPPPPPPAWRPLPADRGRNRTLVFGVVLLIIGAWFFATHTLGLDLPDLDWDQLWPVALIGLGGWIVLTAFRQRSS